MSFHKHTMFIKTKILAGLGLTYFKASGGILQPDRFNVLREHAVEKNNLYDDGTTTSFTRLLVKAVRLNLRYVRF